MFLLSQSLGGKKSAVKTFHCFFFLAGEPKLKDLGCLQ